MKNFKFKFQIERFIDQEDGKTFLSIDVVNRDDNDFEFRYTLINLIVYGTYTKLSNYVRIETFFVEDQGIDWEDKLTRRELSEIYDHVEYIAGEL